MSTVNLIQNIVGGQNVSDVRLANLSESVNMFPETLGEGSSTTQMLRSISGSSLLLSLSTRKCRGIFEASRGENGKPVLFAVFGNELFVIHKQDDGTYFSSKIYSSLTNLDTPVSMCETGGEGSANPHLVVVDGANVIAVNTELSDAEMKTDIRSIALPYRVRQEDKSSPSQRIVPTHCAYAYNYLIVNDKDTDAFYITYQYPFERTDIFGQVDYDIFMINSSRETEVGYKDYGFITYSEWCPDNVTALCSNSTLLYTFGPKSSQIFTYNSDVDAPFTSPTNAANRIGIKAVHSLATIGDYTFFLGSSDIGENGVYFWNRNNLTKCSSPDIERKISKMRNASDAIGQCWTENGHMFYALTFIEDDTTYVFDILEQKWHRRSSKAEKTNTHHYWRLMFAQLHDNKLIFGTEDGKLVYLDSNKFDEYDGRPMIRVRRSGMLMNNHNDFCVDALRLFCNTGDFNDINIVPRIMMRYSESGGAWSNQEIGLMGAEGRYDYEVEWFTLGMHNCMCIEFSCSDPVNFCILNAKIQYAVIDKF